MQKELVFIIMIALSFLLVISVAYAAGISEGGSSSGSDGSTSNNTGITRASQNNVTSETSVVTNESADATTNKTRIDCESSETRRERIKCRLQNRTLAEKPVNVPEACRRLSNPQACIALYNKVRPCYQLEGRNKDRCFKIASGFTKTNLSEEMQARAEKARNYLITLLYDLEERVESAVDSGKITAEKGAEIIDLIVKIKQDILDKKPRQEIRAGLSQLKELWGAANLNE